MGFVLKYCDICNKRIPEDDLVAGIAQEWENRTYCKEHVPDEARAAVNRSRNTSVMRKSGGSQKISGRSATNLPQFAVGAIPAAVAARVTTNPTPAPSASSTTRRRSPAGMNAVSDSQPLGGAPPKKTTTVVAIVGGGLTVIGLVIAIAIGGNKGTGNPDTKHVVGLSPSPSTTSNPNQPPTPNIDIKQQEAERLRATLNKEAEENLTAWEKYEKRHDTLSESERMAEAERWFNHAIDLRKRVAEANLKLARDFDFEQAIEAWAREASKRGVEEIRRRARALLEEQKFTEAMNLVTQALEGRNEQLVPRKYLDFEPKRQLQVLLTEVRNAEDRYNAVPPLQREALQRIEPLERRVQAYATAVQRNEATWTESRALGQELSELNRVYGAALQGNAPLLQRVSQMSRTWIDQTATLLGQEYARVDEKKPEQANAWLDKAQFFLNLTPPNSEPATRINQIVARLRGAQTTGRGGAGPIVRELEAATKGSDITAIYKSLMRTLSFIAQNVMSEKGREKARAAVLDAGRKLHANLKSSHARLGRDAAARDAWFARAYTYTHTYTNTNVDGLKTEVEAIEALFKPMLGEVWTTGQLEAMDKFLTEISPEEAPGMLGMGIWRHRHNTCVMAIRAINRLPNNGAESREMAIAQRNASWCVNDTIVRINANNLRTQQEASRVLAELDLIFRTLLPESNPDPNNQRLRGQLLQVQAQLRQQLDTLPENVSPYED